MGAHSQMTDKQFPGHPRRVVLSRGNRTEVVVHYQGADAVVEKRLLDFANVSTERTALYYEALLQKAASGPGIVPIVDARVSHVNELHEVGEVPEEFASFERHYVKGYSLRELAKENLRHHLTKERCLVWLARVAATLDRVHGLRSMGGDALGLVHRDVTWGNILIAEDALVRETSGGGTSDEGVYLNDFGLAYVRAWGALPPEETLQGSPRFISPELKAGQQPTSASDVYQAALTLCLLLCAEEGKSYNTLIDDALIGHENARGRALLRPFGAESALDENPAERPTALELARLLSR